ncbi:hypothetical protein GCK72_003745 [Caenorhabditis remanei]|uniref:F-box domain-containing protein n=1 Tax=Caenorhabditis remanei TaxID=31234 RepID=A0A6A5H7J3_CAERE|nr:hypothetical protein GCK72_003745 [Caenorhabditis remanei]KAF1763800.1 hypothetical protein GCK72_003745 [Caenorhabditis remanei]
MEKSLKVEVVAVHGFPIQNLPLELLQLPVSLMTPAERLNLASTSNKMENALMKLRFPKVNLHSLHIHDGTNSGAKVADIIITSTNRADDSVLVVKCGTSSMYSERLVNVKTFPKWIDARCSAIANARAIYKVIRHLIPSDGLSLGLGPMKKTDMKRILSAEEFDNWTSADVQGNHDMAAIGFIMNHAYKNRSLDCRESVRFSTDFSHEKAFKFNGVRYAHAPWVRLDHLIAMRGGKHIDLGHTNLSALEVNIFIRLCIDSEKPACDCITIGLTGGAPDEKVVLKGFIYIPASAEVGKKMFFACSNSVGNPNIAIITLDDQTVSCHFNSNEKEILQPRITLNAMKQKAKVLKEMAALKLEDVEQRQRLEKQIEEIWDNCEKALAEEDKAHDALMKNP